MPLPDAAADRAGPLRELLSAVERRVRLGHALRSCAAAAAVAMLMTIALSRIVDRWIAAAAVGAAPGLIVGTIAYRRAAASRSSSAAARSVERFFPDSRNVIVTAEQLLRDRSGVRSWMVDRVVAQAASIAATIRASEVVPLRRPSLALMAAIAVAIAVAIGLPARVTRTLTEALPGGPIVDRHDATMFSLDVVIDAPPYTGVAPRSVKNPNRIEMLQGGRLHISLTGGADVQVRLGTTPVALRVDGSRRLADLAPAESGYLAVDVGGPGTERRLVPVTIIPDRAPVIRIEKPAKDLLMPNAQGTVPLTTSATDDYGLRALELRYTKVSGSGEQFEFTEGSLPLGVTRQNDRVWSGAGIFNLASLGLEPGDSLIYRAVARDARPGAEGTSASDTYFIEVAGPGQVALPGFELPPDRERYALSQQMIVLKIQRLRARERMLARDALAQEAGGIAAEQRAVRSNFIFLLGGHVEDEEEEAEQSSEIQEGRLQNNARREINTAIRFMSEAEQALIAVNTGRALPPARSAVEALQRAFGHSRYFLKTLPVRSRIDPARRLTGELSEASDWRREAAAAAADPKAREARDLLARVFELNPQMAAPTAAGAVEPVRVMAERALAVDPASPDWQRISSALQQLANMLAAQSSPDKVRDAMQQAIVPLVAVAKRSAQRADDALDAGGTLRGVLAEEKRRR